MKSASMPSFENTHFFYFSFVAWTTMDVSALMRHHQPRNNFEKYDTLTKFVYFVLYLAGLMRKKGKKWIPLYTCYYILCLCSMISSTVELFVGSREVEDVADTLSTLISITCAIFRALRFFLRQKQITNIFDRLEVLRLKMLKDKDNKQFVIHAENIGRKILITYIISFESFSIFSFLLVTLSDYLSDFNEHHLFLKIWIPWNHDGLWSNIFTNFLLSLLLIPGIGIFVAIHTLDITFTLYITAYIKTLQNNLINKGIRNESIYEQHKVIIQLIEDYNKALSAIKYIETQISPLMPCGYGYVFIRALRHHEIGRAVNYYMRAFCGLTPAIFSCLCGQQINDEMENLHQATYMTNWYEEEVTVRKTFLTMTIRTTNPSALNYRLFVTFDHMLLSLVLQAVYSYLMVMVNVDTE